MKPVTLYITHRIYRYTWCKGQYRTLKAALKRAKELRAFNSVYLTWIGEDKR